MSLRKSLAVCVLVLSGPLWAAEPPVPAGIVCWKDEDGARVCGDRVPPNAAQLERQLYDGHGRVVDTRPAALTAEQIQAQTQARIEQEQREASARQAKARDDNLLAKYANIDEIIAFNSVTLAHLDARLALSREQLDKTRKTLTAVDKRARDNPADRELAQRLQQYQDTVGEQQAGLERLLRQRQSLCDGAQSDVARFAELTGADVAGRQLCAPAAD